MLELSIGQYNTIYNFFSFGLISMLATSAYLLLSQQRVSARYRNALVVSAMVTLIAAYHYWRIFNNFGEAYNGETGMLAIGGADGFNEAYRYVDWILTVPLLLVETIAVLALARGEARRLLNKLVPASAAMIALGWPGEVATDIATKAIWGVLSTIPFLIILQVLFVELTKSLERQPAGVADTIKRLRLLLIATWGVYPISYLMPMLSIDGPDAFMYRQIGYTVADVAAKCVYGLVIYKIARMKSAVEDVAIAKELEGAH
jgi:bacteriorhodopsin